MKKGVDISGGFTETKEEIETQTSGASGAASEPLEVLDKTHKIGNTDLHYAAEGGDLDIVKLLLEKGVDINKANKDGRTALCCATSRGNLEIVKLLLEKGVEINKADQYGSTAFHYAATDGHLDIVNSLLEKGVEINKADNHGNTALHMATEYRHLEIVKLLLEKMSIDAINIANEDGRTALHHPAFKGHLDIVKLLLEKMSIDVINKADNHGTTPLHIATEYRHLDIVNSLLEKGADINKADNHGNTVLHIATEYRHLEIVKLLLEKMSIDAINKANEDGRTALHHPAFKGHLDIVKLLLEKGADINKADNHGTTPLHHAVLRQDLDLVKFLLEKGADVNQADNLGRTSLHHAEWKSELETIKLITYYKKIHDLLAFDPLISEIEDICEFEKKNGDMYIINSEEIFSKLLLNKYTTLDSLKEYLDKLLSKSIEENKFYQITKTLYNNSIWALQHIDVALLSDLDLGTNLPFFLLEKAAPDLLNIVEILTKLKLGSDLSEEEKISYNIFKTKLQKSELRIIEDFINAEIEIPFEIIEKYKTWRLTDEVKSAIKFFTENPKYKVAGSVFTEMMNNNSDELSSLIIKNIVLREHILKLKDCILPSTLSNDLTKNLIKSVEEIEVAIDLPRVDLKPFSGCASESKKSIPESNNFGDASSLGDLEPEIEPESILPLSVEIAGNEGAV